MGAAEGQHGNNMNIGNNRRSSVTSIAENVQFDCDDDEAVIANFQRFVNGENTNSKRPSSSLASSYNNRNSLFEFSSSQDIAVGYSLDKSTQENFAAKNKEFYGPFQAQRAGLDYDYHGNYSKSRQEFQDKIVEKLLDKTEIHDSTNGMICKTPTEPWIVFTAGVMGAGKSHTMSQMNSRGLFPWKSYVIVDPDEIRSHFPEYHLYASKCPKRAGESTNKEAGYITEIITEAALKRGYNVLVDGSLWDYEWYQEYFQSLRKEYPVLRIAVLHITAPRELVFERATRRAQDTGRIVPLETLELSLKQVPISVKILAPTADFFAELDNSPGDVTMTTEGITWDSFRDNWAQTCPWVPGQRGKM